MKYNWTFVAMGGAADPTFESPTANNTNDGKSLVAVFHSVGTFVFTVTVTDGGGMAVTGSEVWVTVNQAVTTIVVSSGTSGPLEAGPSHQRQFTAHAHDQFENDMNTTPEFTWSTTAGMISSTGLFYAPDASVPVTVTATSGDGSGHVSVDITNSAPTTSLRIGNSSDAYSWEQSLGQPGSDLWNRHVNELKGNVVIVLNAANTDSYTIQPAGSAAPAAFTLRNKGNYTPDPIVTPYTNTATWTDANNVTYTAVDSGTSNVHIVSTLDGAGAWTYEEHYTSSYTVTTTVGAGVTVFSADGTYEYRFYAWGNAQGTTDFTCTVTAFGPAESTETGTYTDVSLVGTPVTGTWTQTTTNTDTITAHTRVSSGSTVYTYTASGNISLDGFGGSAEVSGTNTTSYSYLYDYATPANNNAHNTVINNRSSSFAGAFISTVTGGVVTGGASGHDISTSTCTSNFGSSGGAWVLEDGTGEDTSNVGSSNWYTYVGADAGSTFSGNGGEGYSCTTTTNSTNNGSGWTRTGSGKEHSNNYTSDVGIGHESFAGGTADATNSSGSSSNYDVVLSLAANGEWQESGGMGLASGSSRQALSYMFDDTSDGVTVHGDGSAFASYNSSVVAGCSGGVWTATGIASASQGYASNSSYHGDESLHDSGAGWSYSGLLNFSGSSGSSYNGSVTYLLSSGAWRECGGYAIASGHTSSDISHSIRGAYWPTTAADTISGTLENGGRSNKSFDYMAAAVGTGGVWATMGSSKATIGGNSYSSYTGKGEYTSGTVPGKQEGSGGENSGYKATVEFSATADGWQATGGSGKSFGGSYENYSYTVGTEKKPDATSWDYESYTCGHNNDGSVEYVLNLDTLTWNRDDGKSTSNGSISWSQGTGTTDDSADDQGSLNGSLWSVLGTQKEESESHASLEYKSKGWFTNGGAWQYSGKGKATNGNSASDSFKSDSGTYGANGTAERSWSNSVSNENTTEYALGSTGVWAKSGGKRTADTSGDSHLSCSGNSSTYSNSGTGGWSLTGKRSLDAGNDFVYNSHKVDTLTNGNWTSTGSKSDTTTRWSGSSYSSDENQTYTRTVAGGGEITGTVQENGNEKSSVSYANAFTINPSNGEWNAPTLTVTLSDTSEDHWSYSASDETYSRSGGWGDYDPDNYPYLDALSPYSVTGTLSESGSVNQSSEFSATTTRGSDGIWSGEGSGRTCNTNGSKYSYSGGGVVRVADGQNNASYSAMESGDGNSNDEQVRYWTLTGASWSRKSGTDSAERNSTGSFTYSGHLERTFNAWVDDNTYQVTNSSHYDEDIGQRWNGTAWVAQNGSSNQVTTGQGVISTSTVAGDLNTMQGIACVYNHWFGLGESGSRNETNTTYSDGTPSSDSTHSNLVKGRGYYQQYGYRWDAGVYGGENGEPSGGDRFNVISENDASWHAAAANIPPISGYSGGLSQSFGVGEPPAVLMSVQGESLGSESLEMSVSSVDAVALTPVSLASIIGDGERSAMSTMSLASPSYGPCRPQQFRLVGQLRAGGRIVLRREQQRRLRCARTHDQLDRRQLRHNPFWLRFGRQSYKPNRSGWEYNDVELR